MPILLLLAISVLTAPVSLAATPGSNPNRPISFGMRRLAFATNQFGLDLYRAMDAESARGIDMAVCPFCVSSSLSMMLVGAQGNTAVALRHALYLWSMQPREVNDAFNDLMVHLGANMPPTGADGEVRSPLIAAANRATNATATDMALLTSLYVQRDYNIQYPYHLLLQRFYKTAVHPVDFIHNGRETHLHINAVVEKQTGGKIKDILPRQPFPGTSLLLISALYFRGVLDVDLVPLAIHENSKLLDVEDRPAPEMRTSPSERRYRGPSPFSGRAGHLQTALLASASSPSPRGRVMLSARNARIRHAVNPYLNCSALELPLKGGIMSLVILTPNDPEGMHLMTTRLSAQLLADMVNGMHIRRVNLKMPRVKVEQRHVNMSFALVKLGLIDLFRPDYANLFHVSDYKWLHVSDIIHEAQVDLRSAATPPQAGDPVADASRAEMDITLDRPFMYFVLDNISGLVLAMGRAASLG